MLHPHRIRIRIRIRRLLKIYIRIRIRIRADADNPHIRADAYADCPPLTETLVAAMRITPKERRAKSKKPYPKSPNYEFRSATFTKGTCFSCGGKHLRKDCKFRNAQCRRCNRMGHIERACRKQNCGRKDSWLEILSLISLLTLEVK